MSALGRELSEIRKQFPVLQQQVHGKSLVYLDNAATTQKPRAVMDAIQDYYRNDNANVHRAVYSLGVRSTEVFEHARDTVREFLNAAAREEVIFTRGTTEGLNLLANVLAARFLSEGDEILVSALEHHSNIVPWQLVAKRHGCSLRVLPVDENGELLLEELPKLLSERTRIVSVTHVSNALGTINPVEKIIQAAHAAGALVIVDGAQAVPHLAVDVQSLGADFYVFSSHKIYGPTGMGVLWGRRELLEELEPWQGGGEMIESVSFEKSTWNDLPWKFEAGTPNMAGAVGMAAALRWVMEIGIERIAEHEHQLLIAAIQELEDLPHLRFIGRARKRAAVLSFLVEGAHHSDVATLLDLSGVAVRSGMHCAEPLMRCFGISGTARASFAVYNDESDVVRLKEGLQKAMRMLGLKV